MTEIRIDPGALDRIVPMALLIEADGRIGHVGPTLDKIAPGGLGRPLDRVLRFVQPQIKATPGALLSCAGRRLRVELAGEAQRGPGDAPTPMRCLAIPLGADRTLLTLSFGADPGLALRRHRLSAQDFSPTDPTVDLLFLLEAHAVVLTEFERLGQRLDVARAMAEEEAATDRLTGLRNRRAMDLHLERLSRDGDARFGLMHLDLDYFKSVNDTLGHAAGDHVLEQVARILREEVRRGDMVARVGGDEFMLVFDDCSDVELLQRVAARIIARLEVPIDWQDHVCRISGSIGITMSSFYDPVCADQLMSDADAALYASKRSGRARHSVARPRPVSGAVA